MRVSEGVKTKVPGSKIESVWVLVTPELAKLYMMANIENRAVRPKHVSRLTTDMVEDRFAVTHQGIAFDDSGILIDGQHRLSAILESGKNQWMLVTTGLPSEAKRVVDGGAKRKAADFMPGKFRDMRASAVRVMLAIERCNNEFTGQQLASEMQQVTASAIQDNWEIYFTSDPDAMCTKAHRAAQNVATCGPTALLVGALNYSKTGEEFLDGIAAMTGLEQGDARLALLKFRGGAKRIQSPIAAFIAIKSAKAYSADKKVSVLRYTPSERLRV